MIIDLREDIRCLEVKLEQYNEYSGLSKKEVKDFEKLDNKNLVKEIK
jgi:hypothetical protein